MTVRSVPATMVFSLLVACGGGDDDDNGGGGDSTSLPAPSGADKLGEEGVSEEDVNAGDIDVSDAQAVAYRVSDASFDDVADFYENEIEDDGWTVDEHVALGEMMIAIVHNGETLGLVTAMSAAQARDQGATELGDLAIDLDDLEDDDILIIGATFTCNEDSIDTCIEAMGLGL